MRDHLAAEDQQPASEMIEDYQDKIVELMETTYAELLGPQVTGKLVAVMLEVFQTGLVLGLGQSKNADAARLILAHLDPLGHA